MTDTDAEKGFLARYRAAEKAVRYAAIGFQTECLEGEALATFCARTFAANFPRGYSVELAEFLDSRTRTLKAAHALHESREQARRSARRPKLLAKKNLLNVQRTQKRQLVHTRKSGAPEKSR